MGNKYHGPKFEELPEGLRDRVREAARVAEKETKGLGVIVSEITELYGTGADKLWRGLGDYKEVFIYNFGGLQEACFRTGDKVYRLCFCGFSSSGEKEKAEKALGLNVLKRPKDNQDEAEIRIGDVPLKKLVGVGHQPNTAMEDPDYMCAYSGPYMVRK